MPTKKSDEPVAIDFEKAMTELTDIVEKLEHGGQSLEESLKTFERGIKLTRECNVALEQAEQRVKILLQENGKESLQPFNELEDDN